MNIYQLKNCFKYELVCKDLDTKDSDPNLTFCRPQGKMC